MTITNEIVYPNIKYNLKEDASLWFHNSVDDPIKGDINYLKYLNICIIM